MFREAGGPDAFALPNTKPAQLKAVIKALLLHHTLFLLQRLSPAFSDSGEVKPKLGREKLKMLSFSWDWDITE